MSVEIKTWTTNESLPEQKTWKVSHRTNTDFYEIESNSLFDIIRVMYTLWRNERKKTIKKYINKLSLNNKGESSSSI